MKNTQKKHKFNAIDAAVIIVIVAVIGAAAFFLLSDKETESPIVETANIEYVVELRTIRDDFADNFSIGDSVTDGTALYRIGQIVAVETFDAVYTGTNLVTGQSVTSDYPEHSDVQLTISADASIDSLGRYSIGGYDLSVGTLVYVRTRNYTGYGYCIAIRQNEGGAQ